MSDPIEFTVMGVPTAKGRPRMTRRGICFTPSKTKGAEQSFIGQAIRHAPPKPFNGPISLKIRFCLPVPQSKSKKWKAAAINGEVAHTTKPDLDNLVKLVKDAMNQVFWLDDKQVVMLIAKKLYGDHGETKVLLVEL